MIQVLNSGDELNRSSGISAPGFIVVCVTDSSKEEEKIPLKRKKGQGGGQGGGGDSLG